MSSAYDVSGVLPDGTIDELPPGTNLLVSGPTMVGKRALAVRLLAAGHEDGEGILCVTTSDNAERILDEFRRQTPALRTEQVGIVDCSGSGHQRTIDALATEQVSSPGDLTGISISTAKLLQRFSERDVSDIRHGLVSVSTLLQYLDIETVFKFLHIYTSRIDDIRGLGVFTVDDAAHDRRTISTVASEFDGVLELRETDTDGREIRIKGLPNAPSDWRSF